MATISVLVITFNEETNIRRCLESVKWADEIVLVDAESSDRTVEIARTHTGRIFVRRWEGFAESKKFALQQARGEWVLWLDADETVPPELAREIRTKLPASKVDGYYIPRKANFLGRWILHGGWYPGYVLRLVRRRCARFVERPVHESLQPPAKTAKFSHPILHYTDPNISHYLMKLNNYTSLAAQEYVEKGKHFHLLDLLIRPLHIVIKMYILKCGFLDGLPGFLLAVFSGFHVFVKYAKLWERQERPTLDG